MPDPIHLLDDPATTIAVVGATDDPNKNGGRVYRDLRSKGFNVYAVNPRRATVDGDPAYPTLAALPGAPSLINFVVPPAATLEVLAEALGLDWKTVWLQPGSESPEVLAFLDRHGFSHRSDDCIMVHSRDHSGPGARGAASATRPSP